MELKKGHNMENQTTKAIVTELLESAGISINGNRPYDIQISNEQFYPRVLRDTALGLGESYMDGWWDCERIDSLIEHIFTANLDSKVKTNKRLLFKVALGKIINRQTKKRALIVGKTHYDLGNSLFQNMLDSRMNYSCGYWKMANDLENAQLAKLELICQKLLLKPGMRLLDIGCGFGSLAKYAAEKHQVNVVGITISRQQYEYAKQNCAGLPIEIRFQDYRSVQEKFDRICSIGMFEHVGHLNYRTYMQTTRRCLADDGLMMLHTIGNNVITVPNEWIAKYIFPNGALPTMALISKAAEDLFVVEDWHNFGADYDKTLMAWHENFNRSWETLRPQYSGLYDNRFQRMWNFYLLSCAGGFRARTMQLWQVIFSPAGIRGGYQAPR